MVYGFFISFIRLFIELCVVQDPAQVPGSLKVARLWCLHPGGISSDPYPFAGKLLNYRKYDFLHVARGPASLR